MSSPSAESSIRQIDVSFAHRICPSRPPYDDQDYLPRMVLCGTEETLGYRSANDSLRWLTSSYVSGQPGCLAEESIT